MVPPSPDWLLVSLRPSGRHEGLRAAARRAGGDLIALSTFRIEALPDARATLDAALAASRVVFTSPAAVHAANRLRPLAGWPPAGTVAIAVGAGTASALRRAGVGAVVHPARMDSEGLLSLAALEHVGGTRVGLVTAPGGRGLLQPALEARGARVLRADVYRRAPLQPTSRAVARLLAADAPLAVAVSSVEALAHALATLPPPAAERLRGATAVAASARLADAAREAGFDRVARAEGPRPSQLVAATVRMLAHDT